MYANRVPVVISGINVGSARVNEDGTIELIMGSPCLLGQELLAGLVEGLVMGLSIVPVTRPAVDANVIALDQAPSRRAAREERGFTIRDCTNDECCKNDGD